MKYVGLALANETHKGNQKGNQMQENKQEHFIKNIEIKNFKCFEDFKAEGFGRVNLIGGKNNVGKTAFMEACFLGTSMLSESYESFYSDRFNDGNTDKHLSDALTILSFHRSPTDFLLNNKISVPFYTDSKFKINDIVYQCLDGVSINGTIKTIINNSTFISMVDVFNQQLVNSIFEIKLLNKEDELNNILKELFDIEKVDVIRDEVMFKKREHYVSLNQFGDGIKHFLSIVLTLYLNKNNIVYLDELENGIHYTNLDKLWEIILTISKQQNVQVFATTHSKECIESYARVAEELEDKEITFFKLGKNRKGEIKGMVYPYDWFIDSIEQEEEVRGW